MTHQVYAIEQLCSYAGNSVAPVLFHIWEDKDRAIAWVKEQERVFRRSGSKKRRLKSELGGYKNCAYCVELTQGGNRVVFWVNGYYVQ